jgi:hypothetical protein
METSEKVSLYRVWGADKVAYGPLDLSTLIQWIEDERVTGNSWVLLEAANQWQKATDLSELKPYLAAKAPTGAVPANKEASDKRPADVAPGALRRIKLFADFGAPQLDSFFHYLEVVRFPQFSHIVRHGQHGDAMYVIVEGEVRALTIVEGKESILATLTTGDCFGEISLLDQGPRSADVIANKDSVLLRLSKTAFEHLVREAPALSVPFLLALSRAVVYRIRDVTKKYADTIRFIRTAMAVR